MAYTQGVILGQNTDLDSQVRGLFAGGGQFSYALPANFRVLAGAAPRHAEGPDAVEDPVAVAGPVEAGVEVGVAVGREVHVAARPFQPASAAEGTGDVFLKHAGHEARREVGPNPI